MSFTVDVHRHILPDFFFRETNNAHDPVSGIAPPPWNADLHAVPSLLRFTIAPPRSRHALQLHASGALMYPHAEAKRNIKT